ncbi:MAG TPA: hypothetical protein VGX21_20340 [Methylomirabilota bacterium]|jgi:hypothetical protein|nr:hypothetical protein [Methylomirabilota bacterium]
MSGPSRILGGCVVALGLAVLAAPRPSAAQLPTAQVTLSGSQVHGGEPFTLGFDVTNPAGGTAAEVHVGILLPDGVTFFRFDAAGALIGPAHSLVELTPLEAAPPGFAHSAPAFFSTIVPSQGIPVGTYLFYAALVRLGALGNNALDPGDLLALDVKPLTYGPGVVPGQCTVFPPDNAWNTDISAFPVHPNSANFIARIGGGNLHPDFGTIYGIPFTTVPGDQPRVPISFYYADESDPGPYPIPPDAPIEGGSDHHVLVLDRDTCVLYEVFDAEFTGSEWLAGSGAVWDLKINATRPAGWTSADAAGLPIFPGLVRYEEVVEQGEIRHALRFTVAQTRRGYIFPASHWASSSDDPDLPPMGLRLRLKAGFDVSTFHPSVQVILRALQRYGMIVADNGTSWFITGAPDPRWDDAILDQLKTISGGHFEVVYTGDVVTP